MKEELVSYMVALKAKENGFRDSYCSSYYDGILTDGTYPKWLRVKAYKKFRTQRFISSIVIKYL